MQAPTMNTPVSKCVELSTHAARMLGKFTHVPALLELAIKMTAAGAELSAGQVAYEDAVKAILPTRVDVKYENYVSDRRIRLVQQKVEIADGRRFGRIAGLVFPEGSSPITRLVGDSQTKAMQDLEGRLAAVVPLWPDAQSEWDAVALHREQYEKALSDRNSAGQAARDKRAARNAIKQQFITTYVEIMSRVEAEFPRDRVTQDLFFDEVRTKSALAAADASADEEPGDEGPVGGNDAG